MMSGGHGVYLFKSPPGLVGPCTLPRTRRARLLRGLHRIGARVNVAAERAAEALGRHFEALSPRVEQPAVEQAAQFVWLQPVLSQISAAMRTMPLDKGVAPLRIAKQHEILAEQPDGLHGTGPLWLVDQGGRLPIRPQEADGRGIRPAPRH